MRAWSFPGAHTSPAVSFKDDLEMPFSHQPDRRYAGRRCQLRRPAVFHIGLTASCAVLFLASDTPALAQSIVAPPAESLTHNRNDASQVFPEVVWQLYSGVDSGGYTVQWSCGPFVHSVQGALKADARLAIRVVASDGFADWRTTVPNDQTSYAGGDETAAAAAQSVAVGDGQVGLTVTFLNDDYSRLAAGSYTTTVVGTITAN